MLQTELRVETQGQGLYLITDKVVDALRTMGPLPQAGMLNLFLRHTSASLIIQENASPSAQHDLETFLKILVPENQRWHTHLDEGPDDTTSHLKASVTQTSLSIPIVNGRLGLGTWQGIYLWEHRDQPHQRHLILTVLA